MQINSTNNYSINKNPNFCAIKATAEAKKYIKENFSKKAMEKLNKLIEQEKDNSLDINISVARYKVYKDYSLFKPACCCDYLEIIAGDKTFTDINLFTSSIAQIQKAVKYLPKFKQSQDLERKHNSIIEKL